MNHRLPVVQGIQQIPSGYWIAGAGWLVYLLFFFWSHPFLGVWASIWVLVPVAITSVLGGMGAALIAAFVSFSVNSTLYISVNEAPMSAWEHLPGNLFVLFLALILGWAGDVRRELSAEVQQRRLAQEKLRELNQNLDNEVQRRSQQLAKTLDQLMREENTRRAAEQEASYREAILATVSSIAEMTLRADSWARAMPLALKQLGVAANVNRAYIFRNSTTLDGRLKSSQIFEWVSPGTTPHIEDPKLQDFDFEARGFQRWVEILSRREIVNDLVSDLPPTERRFLEEQGVDSILIVPIFAGQEWWGQIGFDSMGSPRIWSPAEKTAIRTAGNIIGAAIQREQDYDKTLQGWARALELRDQDTEGHTRRVTTMTVRLAERLGYLAEELTQLERGAMLHDVGKVGIPDSILLKPGPLTKREWLEMKKHPVYARDMLSPIEFLQKAITIPYYHHERWDGSGYPQGLRGNDIPLEARIFAIVDVWDALSSDRPYRDAWPTQQVLDHLERNSGVLFDPGVVPVFVELLDDVSEKIELESISLTV